MVDPGFQFTEPESSMQKPNDYGAAISDGATESAEEADCFPSKLKSLEMVGDSTLYLIDLLS